MTLATSVKIAALMTVGLAGTLAAEPLAKGAKLSPSSVASGALPSCSADGGMQRKFISGRAFRGGALTGGMYGQVFFAAGRGEARGRESSKASTERGNGGGSAAGSPGKGPQNSQPPAGSPDRGPQNPQPPAANLPDTFPADPQTGPGGPVGAGPADPLETGPGGPVGVLADPAVAHTPEPGTLLLIGAGLGAVAVRRRRQRQKTQGS
jgi:hypothetical protein